MSSAFRDILRHPDIWRLSEASSPVSHALPTGYETLDQKLPGGGWPLGSLTEILHDQQGIGEIRLLMPAMARLSRTGRWITWIAPPRIPYAPALADHGIDLSRVMIVEVNEQEHMLWAAEQTLRTHGAGMVLLWLSTARERSLRRLQRAAESGGSLAVTFGPGEREKRSSPAALRLRLCVSANRLVVRVLKCRGAASGEVTLTMERTR